jgi:hypothetical protein
MLGVLSSVRTWVALCGLLVLNADGAGVGIQIGRKLSSAMVGDDGSDVRGRRFFSMKTLVGSAYTSTAPFCLPGESPNCSGRLRRLRRRSILERTALGAMWLVDTIRLALEAILIRRWCDVASTATMTAGPGGMVQQSLGVGCVMVGVRREVASTAGLTWSMR